MSDSNASARLRWDVAQLALGQLRDLVNDLGAAGREVGLGSMMMAGAAGCAVMSLLAMHQTALRALEALLPRPAASTLLAIGYGGTAAVLAVAARSKLLTAAEAAEQAVREQTD